MKTRFTALLNLLFLITPALTALANPMLLPPPSVPTNVAAAAVSTTQINLTWAAPTSADQTSYQIEYATDAGFSSPTSVIPDPGASATSQAITGLTANTLYHIRIRAVNGLGPSANVAVQATTFPGPPTLNTPTSVTNTSASLTWSAPSGTAALSNYQLSLNGGAFNNIGTAQPYVATLSPNTAYTFTLKAVNAGGTSDPSNSVGATTLPNAPGTIGFSAITNNSITLTWAAPSGGAVSYQLQIDGGAAIPVTSPYAAGGLSANTVHNFSLVAVNGSGTSTPTTGSQITLADAPTGLVASSPSTNSLSLAWTAPGGSGTLTNYELSTNGGGGTLINQTSSPYNVGSLSANTAYSFTLKAQNAAGLSAESAPSVSVTTLPNPPSGLTASNITTSGLQLDWTASAGGATGYSLVISGAGSGTGTFSLGSGTTSNVTGLSPNVNYTFSLTGTNASGASSAIQLTRATQPNAPGTPTVGTIGTTSVALSWAAPSGDALSGYSLSTNGGTSFTAIGNPSQPYTVGGLSPNTAYTFVLKALNTQGLESAASGSATATTLPNAPGTIAFSAITTNGMTLTWAPGAGGAASYQLQVNGGTATTVTSPYVISSGLSSNTVQNFSLVAFNATGGASAPTTGSQITLPIAPASLAASGQTTSGVTLNWTPPSGSGPLTEYVLSTNGGTFTSIGLPGLPYNQGGLTSNTPYSFSLKAKNAAGESAVSNTVTTATLPDAPGSFAAGSVNTTSLTLTWTAPSGTEPLTGYQLDRATDAGFTQNLTALPVAGTPLTVPVSGLSSNTRYYFRLRATNAMGASAYSTTNALTLPDAPTALTTSNVTSTSAQLAWTAPPGSGPLTGYQLSTNGGTSFGTTQSISSPFTVGGLTPNTAYTFVLKAENATGLSVASVSATQITTLPATPTSLTATATAETSITLGWTAPTNGATSYSVAVTGSGTGTGTFTSATTSLVVSGLSPNVNYTFTLTALNGTGASAPTAPYLRATLPLSATVPTTTAITNNSLTLGWTPPAGDALTGYSLLITGSGTGTGTFAVPVGSSYNVTGLSANTAYTFALTSQNASGNSTPPLTKTATTRSAAPTGLTATATAETSITLGWTAPTGGADSYSVVVTGSGTGTGTFTSATTSLVVSGLSPNVNYTFVLTALNGTGASDPTAPYLRATLPLSATVATTTAITNNSLTLGWTPPSGDALTGYSLVITGSGGGTGTFAVPVGNSYNVTGLSANTAYTFALTSQNASGNSTPPVTKTATTLPATPTGLTATATAETSITLGWTAPTDGATSYSVVVTGSGTGTGTFTSATTSLVVSGLSPNVNYTFVLTAINGTGASAPTAPYLRATLPLSATVAMTTAITNNSLTLGWTPPAGDALTGYSLLITGSGGGTGTFAVPVGSSYNVTGLSANTAYTFALTSQNASGNSTPPVMKTATTLPATPTGLTATATAETSITLGWTAPTDGATSYSVVVTGSGTGTGTFTSATTSLVVSGLSPNVNYTFTLTAINGTGASAPTAPYLRATLPLSATVPTTTAITNTSLTLGWTPPTGDALTGYSLVITGSGTGTGTFAVPVGSSYNVTGLTANTAYTFDLTSQNASGNSTLALSTTATTLPNAPTGLMATATTETSITLGWTAPTDGATSYSVVVTGSGTGTGTFTSVTTSLVISGLSPNVNYTFTLTAINGTGASAPAAPFSRATLPGPPSAPVVGTITTTTIALTWTPPSGDAALTDYLLSVNGSAGPFTSIGTTQPYTVPGLSPNTAYTFALKAVNASGQSVASGNTPATTLPGAPTGLVATTVTTTTVALNWAVPTGGAPSYNVAVTGSGSGTGTFTTTAPPLTITGLSPNTAYTFTLTALNAGGGASAPTSISLPTLPEPPTALTVSNLDIQTLTLNWTPPAGDALTGYSLVITGTGTGTGTLAVPVGNTYNVTGLTPNTAYSFALTAVNASGNSTPPTTVNSTTLPRPITALAATALTTTSLTLGWTAPADGAASYQVVVSSTVGGAGGTGTFASPTTSFAVASLTPNTPYTFAVTALNAASGASTPVQISLPTLPDPPTTLTAAPIGATSLTLNWTPPSGTALTGYSLLVTTAGGGTGTGTFPVGVSSTVAVPDLTPNTTYTFALTAINASGNSATAASTTATTLPNSPTALVASGITTTSMVLGWTAPAPGGSPNYSLVIGGGAGSGTIPLGAVTTYTAAGLDPNTTYTFSLTAVNGTGASSPATLTKSTKPNAPGTPTAATIGTTSVALNWGLVSGNALSNYTLAINGGTPTNIGIPTLPYSATGLTPNTSYTFVVKAVNVDGLESDASGPLTVVTLPGPPSTPVASAITTSGMTLTWTAPPSGGAAGYRLTISGAGTGTGTLPPLGNVLTTTVTGLSPNVNYTFTLVALNSEGVASTPTAPLVQPTLPGPPTAVQALPGATSSTAVQLSWTPPVGDALSGYSLVITGSGDGTGTFAVPLGSTYTANGLTPNTQYTFSLTALNLSGSSTAVTVNPITRPAAPTNLQAGSPITTTAIPITWTPPAGGTVPLSSYEVQYSSNGGVDYTTVLSPPAGGTSSFTITGLLGNTLYTIRIRAQNSTGYGEYVTTTATTTPDAPSNLQAPPATITASSVGLTWTAPSGAALTNYDLYYSSGGATTTVVPFPTASATSYNVTGLMPNTLYTFLLFSRNASGASTAFAQTTGLTLPAAPSNFQATAVLQTSMTVNWLAPTPGAVLDYELQYSANPTFASGVTTLTPAGAALSQPIAGLSAYTPYYFRLRARNATGFSAYVTLSQTTLPNPPVAPTNVQVPVALITQNKATVTWTGSPGPLLNYVIEFSNSASFTPLSGSVSPDSASRSFDILSLSSGTTYYFRMKAVNTGGTSANSATVSATTLPNPPLGPTGLQVTASTQTTISLSWTAPVSGDQNSYELRYSTNPDFLQDVFIRILPTTGTTYTATDLLPNTAYYFRLYARNTGGTSADFTNAAGSTKPYPPAAPSALAASNVLQTGLTLTWTAPTGPLTGYVLSYSTSAGFADSTIVTPAPASGAVSQAITGLVANTTYYFRLRAVNAGGSSPNATLTVITPPSAPTAPGTLTATNVQQTTLTLNWTAPAGGTQTGYRLVYSTSAGFADSTTVNPAPGAGATSQNLTGLTGNTTYYFKIYALNTGGSSAPATAQALTKPAAPTALAAPTATLTQTGLTLTWTAPAVGSVSTLTNYELQYATSADFTAGLVTTNPANTATSEAISGLSPNLLYYFRLRAQNATGFSTYATLQTTTLPAAPLAPTVFAASAITTSSLTLTWTAPAGPITSYQLDRATDAGFTQNLVSLTPAAGATSQAISGLSGGTQYFFRLRAVNAGGNSPYATTDAATVLAPPTGFAVAAGSITQTALTLNWVAPSGTLTGYELQQATDAGFTQNLVTLTPAAGATSQAITGLSGNTLYYFRLRAQNGGGFSGYASTQATTPPAAPAAPTPLTATAITTSSLTLTWTAPAGPITSYQLDRATDAGFTQNVVSLTPTGSATSQAISGLSGGTQYFFRLRAVNAGGNSPYATTDATTLLAPPATPSGFAVAAGSITQTALTLNWNAATGTVTGYELQQATDAGFTQNLVTLTPAAGATSQAISGLSGGTPYFFRLRAQNAGGFSGYASTQATTLPSAPGTPGNFAASNVGQTTLTVSWTSPGGPISSYELQYSTDQNFGGGVTTLTPGSGATSQSISGLNGGTQYFFRLRAQNGGGFSGYASTQATTQQAPPAAPVNFTASAISSSQINLNWSNVGGQTALELQYSTSSNFGTNLQNISVGGDATSASVTGLATTTAYYFRLRAQNGGGFSNYVTAQATTLLEAPGAPSGLTASALSTSQIRLQWNDNASNEQGYYVEASVNGGGFNQIATLGANSTTYTASGLAESTNYTYRVRAYNSAGTSAASNTASATTPLGLPAAPTTLVARATGQTTIALTWLDVATNESGYEVERSTDGTNFTPLAQVGANTNSYAASGLTAATSYSFRVRATNATGPSPYSNVATIKTLPLPPTAPSDLVVTPATQTSVQLNWKDNSANETGFEVERSSDSLNFTAVATVPAGSIQAQVTGLTSNTRYYFRLRAVNEGGASAYTAIVRATTLPIVPNGPANLVASDTTQSTVKLTWKDNATDETGYEILQAEGLTTTLVRVALLPANSTTTIVSGLKVDQVYRFTVRSVNTGGSSTPSNEISLQTLPFLPLAPANVQTKVLTQTAIRVLWDNPAGAITKTEVEQSLDGKTFSVGKVLPGNAVATEFTGLPSNTIFYFRLRAFNRAGTGAYSVMVKDTTLPTMPAAPTNLTSENVRARQLRLRWKDNADSEANFEVELFRNGRFERIVMPTANSDTVTITGLTDLTDYRFRVRAINRAGTSAYTNEATARTTLGPPDGLTNLTLTANPSLVTQVKLRWTIPNVRILDSVEVERSTDGITFSVVQRLAGRTDSTTVTSLDPSQRYVFRVRGKNQVGFSPYSNLVERPVVATGVEDPALAAVRLRPNPVDDELVIETEDAQTYLRAVEGYHLSGQRAFRYEFDGRDSKRYLSLGHLPHGIYLLRIETSAGMTQRKMLKN